MQITATAAALAFVATLGTGAGATYAVTRVTAKVVLSCSSAALPAGPEMPPAGPPLPLNGPSY